MPDADVDARRCSNPFVKDLFRSSMKVREHSSGHILELRTPGQEIDRRLLLLHCYPPNLPLTPTP